MKTAVNIEITKGVGEISSYRGLVDADALEAILDGSYDAPFVRLEEVLWTEKRWNPARERSEHVVIRIGETEPYEHHTGEVWFRPCHIATILPMTKFPDQAEERTEGSAIPAHETPDANA